MGKISPEEKIEWVEKIIQNKESVYSVASKIGVHPSSIDTWVRNYKSIGTEAFFRKGWTKRSSAEKKSAVEDYLAGKGSLRDICAKYKITDTYQLRTWIKQYNGHEVLKDSGTGGSPIMTKGRKTAFEERVEIVQYCIKHNHNYAETAEKFSVSYQQARNYTIKYEKKRCGRSSRQAREKKVNGRNGRIGKTACRSKDFTCRKETRRNGDFLLKKIRRNREEAKLSLIRHEHIYQAIKEEHEKYNYPILVLCKLGGISRAAYYKWLNQEVSANIFAIFLQTL